MEKGGGSDKASVGSEACIVFIPPKRIRVPDAIGKMSDGIFCSGFVGLCYRMGCS